MPRVVNGAVAEVHSLSGYGKDTELEFAAVVVKVYDAMLV